MMEKDCVIRSVNPLSMKCRYLSWKTFFPHFDFGFSWGWGHVVCTPNWTRSNVIKESAIPHLLLKGGRKPPIEEPWPLVPVPIWTGTGLEDTVMYCGQIFWVSPIPVPPMHSFSAQVMSPPADGKASSSVSWGVEQAARSTLASSAWAAATQVETFSSRGEKGTSRVSPGREPKATLWMLPECLLPNLNRTASKTNWVKHRNIMAGGAERQALKIERLCARLQPTDSSFPS